MNKNIGIDSKSAFTLLDTLIGVASLSILLSIGLPSFLSYFEKNRLIGAAEQMASHLLEARSEAVARSQNISFNVSAGSDWLYGFSTTESCNLALTAPTTFNACVISIDDGDQTIDPGDGSIDKDDLVLMRFTSAEHEGISASISNFSSGDTTITFDSVRGTASTARITLSSNFFELSVGVGLLGDVKICASNSSMEGEYSSC